MAEGGFNLRKLSSNSSTLVQRIQEAEAMGIEGPQASTTHSDVLSEEDETYTKATTGSNNNTSTNEFTTKVLGINWNCSSDKFIFTVSEILKYASKLPVSKRSLLKITAKLFDPLGFLSPFVIKLKILFQTLCAEKVDWDDTLEEKVQTQWQSIISELNSLEGLEVPRCYFEAIAAMEACISDIQNWMTTD